MAFIVYIVNCAMVAALLACGAAPQMNEAPRVRFEMRLAENEPGEGLTAATLPENGKQIYLHAEALATNEDVISTNISEIYGAYEVDIVFSQEAAERVGAATEKHIGKPMAILVDGRVMSAPVVQSRVTDRAVIAGNFSREEAQRLADGIAGRR